MLNPGSATGCCCRSRSSSRRMRAFKRWMKWKGIEWSDALDLIDNQSNHQGEGGMFVRALCDLHEGDLVATIPKQSCLTIKTSGACDLIESAGLEGSLALSFAIMYEKSLGQQSPWFDYLQLLPQSESIPLVWSFEQIDSLLAGTELHKMVKEDKAHVYEDWKACILPILDSAPVELNPIFFGVEQYFAAKSLVASRSFAIDDYHGFGMVPLADLFNHKTGAEDVHFTAVSCPSESDSDNDGSDPNENDDANDDSEPLIQNFQSRNSPSSPSKLDSSSDTGDNSTVREMIMVRDVKAGAEVYNTYGLMGNAGLLHRYGFTEWDNPYDIVNIDLELVLQWSSSLFSSRYSRARLSLWRRLDYSGTIGENSEYFEISFNGEPEVELLILLYIMLLPEETYSELDLRVSTEGWALEKHIVLSKKENIALERGSEACKSLLLTKGVRGALLRIADIRESFYREASIDNEIEALKMERERGGERESYHSRGLRVSERRILEKLRNYVSSFGDAPNGSHSARKKLKRK
ncbi:hypothetical protein LguiB_010710 [Lonicera macranthoides]